MASLGDLVINLRANTRQFQAGMRRTETSMQRMVGVARTAATAIAGYFTFRSVTGIVKLATDAEMLQRQLTVLSGSETSGAKIFGDIEKFAINTALSLDETAQAATKLMATGVSQNELMGTLQLLGDLSMGDANRLGFLSKAYTDVLAKGRLMGQEIRQFAENGVPLIQALADQYGVTAAEILKMSEAGQISFSDMQRALISLTSEGGQFSGMLSSMAETTGGKLEILAEKIRSIGRDIGETLLPVVNWLADSFIHVQDTVEDVGTVAGVVAAHMGSAWKTMFEDIMKWAGEMLGFLTDNFAIMIKNMGSMVTNLFSKLDQWGRQLGEELAFQLGLSDEKLEIPESRMQKLQEFRGMQTPAGLSDIGKTLGKDIADALESNQRARAGREKWVPPKLQPQGAIGTSLPLGPGFAMQMAFATNPANFVTDAPLPFAGAAERGSVESLDTLMRAMNQGSGSPQEQANKLLADMNKKFDNGIAVKPIGEKEFAIVEDI